MKLLPRCPSWMQRAVVTGCAALLLAQSALATWSIVAVNTRTGEVCVASATCLTSFNLKPRLAVILVGKGAAAAQSIIDVGAVNRMKIWNGILAGTPPQGIIDRLAQVDTAHDGRQYGIVTLKDGDLPATFTGSGCSDAAYGVSGFCDDDIRYSIQGNILTGNGVVYYAESAFLITQGDLSQKVMAAMEAARSIGGDGRCSCSNAHPMQCGAPPPSFQFSAYTSFIVLARMGDTDGVCQDIPGCANGSYYLDLKVISSHSGVEPVLQLEADYAAWRASLANTVDHIRSSVQTTTEHLVADGKSHKHVDIQLKNIDGVSLTNVPATLQINHTYAGGPFANTGPITDHGAGHFSFDVTADDEAGDASWSITVVQAGANVRLYPDLKLRVDPLQELHCGYERVSATSDFHVPLTINMDAALAGRTYLILGSATGTTPGVNLTGGFHMPLNRDAFFMASYLNPNSPTFSHTMGALDADARAQAEFVVSPALLVPLIGQHIDFASVTFGFPTSTVTNVAGFDVVP